MKKNVLCLVIAFMLAIFVNGCSFKPMDESAVGSSEIEGTNLSSTDGAEEKTKIEVAVSILPQAEFVEKIGGDKVNVTVMIPPGASPATYEPTPSQLVNLSLAKVYIKIGYVPFEMAWMDRLKATNKDMIVVDSSKGIEIIGDDPHIWLSPMLVKKQAKSIYEALSEINPENEAYYQKNLAVFLGELDKVDEKIKVSLSGFGGKKFMVFHPAWGYFAREYGLEQIPIEVEGKEPSADDIVKLVKIAKQEGIKVIFASPQLSDKSAEVIAKEIGGKVVLIDPLAEDYINNMNKICQEIGKGLV